MFKKAAVFTDLHLGLKGNSKTHNQDCEEFIDWFINQAQLHNCDTGICCGDYHHSRSALSITTLSTSIKILEKLGKSFKHFFYFPGNHDLYYKDKRDLHSVEFGRHISGITVINSITVDDNVALVPWLIGDEWKKISKINAEYMFGHFELPTFYMNSLVRMPDHGDLRAEHFVNQKYVFSGHFHKRQVRGNIHYIGNAFPHNYADAWDDDRGMMIIDKENGLEPVYLNWDNCPRYRTVKLSELLEPDTSIIKEKMHLRVAIDIPISYEEASFIKETFVNQHKCRELTLIPQKQLEEINTELNIEQFKSIDTIVSSEIAAIDSDNFDKNLLLSIYEDL